ncbi:MAG: DUF373 family protein [archaeon]|nr:DUF373 family protein [archaeon]
MDFKTKILIICVDRDNDIGEKAGLNTPIIGREANLLAVTKLALADPENSDINAIFEAIKIYDGLTTEEGTDVGVVLIAGDKNVGIESDTKIGQELDEVLSKLGADSAIIVSDGTGDERIIPIIQSRVKIDSVRRVIVKQIGPLGSSFYGVARLIEDQKFSRTFLPPIGLILFLLAISSLFGLSEKALGLILGFIGIYILLKGLGRENIMSDFVNTMKQSSYRGTISSVIYISAIMLILTGTFQGVAGSWGYYAKMPEVGGYILLVTWYIKQAIWWYVGAAFILLIGKMMDISLKGESISRLWTVLFPIIASALILWGGSKCIITGLRPVDPENPVRVYC